MEPITSILDARLPQPHEWHELPPPLGVILRKLSERRSRCADAQVDAWDRLILTYLMPYRKDCHVS
jgi:hypothetical protein